MLFKQNTVPLKDVLQVYADLTKRTLLIGSQIPAINLEYSSNEILDNGESLQIIEATLNEHGIVVEDYGSKYAKILRKGGLRSGLIFEWYRSPYYRTRRIKKVVSAGIKVIQEIRASP